MMISLAMWGLYPAAIEILDETHYALNYYVVDENPLEVQWLLAWWDRYMGEIEQGKTFELAQLGQRLDARLLDIDHGAQWRADLEYFQRRLAIGLAIPKHYLSFGLETAADKLKP